MSLTK